MSTFQPRNTYYIITVEILYCNSISLGGTYSTYNLWILGCIQISQKSIAEFWITLHRLYCNTVLICPLIRNMLWEQLLLHLESSIHLELLSCSKAWSFFCKVRRFPYIKLKFYDGRNQPLERSFDWYIAIPILTRTRQSLYVFLYAKYVAFINWKTLISWILSHSTFNVGTH